MLTRLIIGFFQNKHLPIFATLDAFVDIFTACDESLNKNIDELKNITVIFLTLRL